MKKPDWWPENPYPKSIFPMQRDKYAEIVPEPNTRTALSGMLGREFWEIASNQILLAYSEYVGNIASPLDKPFMILNFSVRTKNVLRKMGIRTIGDLVRKTPTELLCKRNFGESSLREVERKLKDINLQLS